MVFQDQLKALVITSKVLYDLTSRAILLYKYLLDHDVFGEGPPTQSTPLAEIQLVGARETACSVNSPPALELPPCENSP